MKQLLKLDDCIGKTVKRVSFCSVRIGLVFEDDSFILFDAGKDYDGYCEIETGDSINQETDHGTMWELGFISAEEYDEKMEKSYKEHQESIKVRDLETLRILKEKYEQN